MTTYTLETSGYNDRRYGRPYIAKLDFASDPRGVCIWGVWIGSPGEAGELTIDVVPGDVLMTGQKDNRNPRNSAPEYGYVDATGKVTWCNSKIEAIRAARNIKSASNVVNIRSAAQ